MTAARCQQQHLRKLQVDTYVVVVVFSATKDRSRARQLGGEQRSWLVPQWKEGCVSATNCVRSKYEQRAILVLIEESLGAGHATLCWLCGGVGGSFPCHWLWLEKLEVKLSSFGYMEFGKLLFYFLIKKKTKRIALESPELPTLKSQTSMFRENPPRLASAQLPCRSWPRKGKRCSSFQKSSTTKPLSIELR